jgi:hypothetical protein
LPVVVTKSMFQDAPLLFIGMAPPPLDRNEAASRMSCMSSKGAPEISAPPTSLPSISGPAFSMATPLLTSSTWPSSSAVMAATRL